jgi:xanthine dehydrogenase/oxidase
MSTDLYGMAVLDACEQIQARLMPVRKQMEKDGQPVPWNSLIESAFYQRVDLSAHGYYAVDSDRCGYDWNHPTCGTDNSQRGMPFNYFTQGVACSEVEIDCLTGDSTVLRTDINMDIGKSINPALDIGQIEGAFIQGFGWSTMEELVWGDSDHPWVRPGHLFTRGPGTYKIPAFNDVPKDFRIYLSDTENPFCIHSSKAIGEPPFFPRLFCLFCYPRGSSGVSKRRMCSRRFLLD